MRFLRIAARYGGSSTSAIGEVERHDADRNVEKEDPAPAVVVDDPAADGWAEHRRHDHGDAVNGESHAALFRSEGVGQDRLLAGLQAAAGRALNHAKEHQHAQCGRKAAEQRGDGEQEDAGHVEALAAHAVCDPAADGQHHGVGDQVAGQHPGGFVAAGGERTADVRHGDVGDGGVERLHEGGQGDSDGDDPGIGAGPPCVVERSCGRRRQGWAFLSLQVSGCSLSVRQVFACAVGGMGDGPESVRCAAFNRLPETGGGLK